MTYPINISGEIRKQVGSLVTGALSRAIAARDGIPEKSEGGQ